MTTSPSYVVDGTAVVQYPYYTAQAPLSRRERRALQRQQAKEAKRADRKG